MRWPPALGVMVVEKPFVQGGTHTGRRVRRFFKTSVQGWTDTDTCRQVAGFGAFLARM